MTAISAAGQHVMPARAQAPRLMSVASSGPRAPAAEPRSRSDAQLAPSPVRRGPLVAVCGLCGGAGASTLAYLIARWAALDASGHGSPVLALDAGGTTGGLSRYSQTESACSLAELSEQLHTVGRPPAAIFAETPGGVRLIATSPRPQPEFEPGLVIRVLTDAREVHGMTVVDCGTLSLPAERLALELATHVIWVVPATDHGLGAADLSSWGGAPYDAVHVLVARQDPSARTADTRALAAVAEARGAALVLMPRVETLDARSLEGTLEACGLALQALATKLR